MPAAMVAANLLAYALLLVAARHLTRADYGELVSLLGVLLVATVPALAMQTVAARRTALAMSSGVGTGLLRGTAAISLISAAALLAAALPLARFLHLHTWWGLVAVALCAPGLTLLGTLQGQAQGRREHAELAALTLAGVGSRALGGLAGVLVGGTSVWCAVGTFLGVTAAAGGAGMATRSSWTPEPRHGGGPRTLVVEAGHAAHGYAAFLTVTSMDVLLARHVLAPSIAGTYAAGSVVTRAALWLPQSVAVLAFPVLTNPTLHRRTYEKAVTGLALIGGCTVLGVAGLGRVTVSVVAGARFHMLDNTVWIFAATGAALAVLQLSIVAGLAVLRPGRIALVWAVAVLDVAAAQWRRPTSATELAATLAVVGALGALASVVVALRARYDRAPDALPAVQALGSAGDGTAA